MWQKANPLVLSRVNRTNKGESSSLFFLPKNDPNATCTHVRNRCVRHIAFLISYNSTKTVLRPTPSNSIFPFSSQEWHLRSRKPLLCQGIRAREGGNIWFSICLSVKASVKTALGPPSQFIPCVEEDLQGPQINEPHHFPSSSPFHLPCNLKTLYHSWGKEALLLSARSFVLCLFQSPASLLKLKHQEYISFFFFLNFYPLHENPPENRNFSRFSGPRPWRHIRILLEDFSKIPTVWVGPYRVNL